MKTKLTWTQAQEIAKTVGVKITDRTWRDEESDTEVALPSYIYSEEYWVACGVPTFTCSSEEQKNQVLSALNQFES